MISESKVSIHFKEWTAQKITSPDVILLNQKKVKYFEDDYLFCAGFAEIVKDIYNCNLFSEAKYIIDYAVVNNHYTDFLISFKTMLYDHEQFFIDNKKKLLFEQVEKYLAFNINTILKDVDDILITIDEVSKMFNLDRQTFQRHYIDTGILAPIKITPGNVNGYNARFAYKKSVVQDFIKRM